MGELISEYFNLETVKSLLMKSETENFSYFLLSRLFNAKKKEYAIFDTTLFPRVKIKTGVGLDNLNRLNKYIYNDKSLNMNKEMLERLKFDIKKMIIRDFITHQNDRHNLNFLFKRTEKGVKLLPLFDYESSFDYSEYGKTYRQYFNNFDFILSLKK